MATDNKRPLRPYKATFIDGNGVTTDKRASYSRLETALPRAVFYMLRDVYGEIRIFNAEFGFEIVRVSRTEEGFRIIVSKGLVT